MTSPVTAIGRDVTYFVRDLDALGFHTSSRDPLALTWEVRGSNRWPGHGWDLELRDVAECTWQIRGVTYPAPLWSAMPCVCDAINEETLPVPRIHPSYTGSAAVTAGPAAVPAPTPAAPAVRKAAGAAGGAS